ncbi:hypothetical protein [Roseibacillus ishigakijimensis]|uniref:Uncharacterized protein n=1 Tax=Roseibacillus ishigakijimensis TaxID=454146 RepID=A0A934RU84_9BACT|nr:hypothetical protein [Roseibacillus ishigakijimensis]MBK1835513.1 hypothetical protein [Roseibacillus ishigakijimensis]
MEFEIQEMRYQDAAGVVFQAVDRRSGKMVALRRFFLPEVLVARLRQENEEGQSLYERELAALREQSIPHLRRVLDGGFDDLDETPYFVTEWLAGESLAQARQDGTLQAGDRRAFEAQCGALLRSLPPESQAALALSEEEIILSRDEAGELSASFTLSPERYFTARAGGEVSEVKVAAEMAKLADCFPSALMSSGTLQSRPVASQAVPLKSAQTGSGKGVFWASVIAFPLVLLGLGLFVFFSQSRTDDSAGELVSAEKSPAEKAGPLVGEEEEPPAESVPEEAVEEEEAALAQDESGREEEDVLVARGQAVASEPSGVASPEEAASELPGAEPEQEFVATPAIAQEEDEPEPHETPGPEGAVDSAPIYSPLEADLLRDLDGQEVTIVGTPTRSAQSGGKGTLWYLDFEDDQENAFLTFRHLEATEEVAREQWDALVGQEIRARVTVQAAKQSFSRGSGVYLYLNEYSDLSLVPVTPVYSLQEVGQLSALQGEEVLFRGTFDGFVVHEEHVYLMFAEGPGVSARFVKGGPLSTRSFKEKGDSLQGQQVQVRGRVVPGPTAKISLVLEIDEEGDLAKIE